MYSCCSFGDLFSYVDLYEKQKTSSIELVFMVSTIEFLHYIESLEDRDLRAALQDWAALRQFYGGIK